MATSYLVAPQSRRQYGIPLLDVIATNNPNALFGTDTNPRTGFPPEKVTECCDNQALADCWRRDGLCTAVTELTLGILPPSVGWRIDLYRMSFADHGQNLEPCQVIHLILTETTQQISELLLDQLATKLVSLVNTKWHGDSSGRERVYIDICKIVPLSAATNDVDLSSTFAELYQQSLPLPGSSIGIVGGGSGTLTGYIVRNSTKEVYALTCAHCVGFHDFYGRPSPLPGSLQRKYPVVYSPSPSDHLATKKHIQAKVRWFKDGSFVPLLASRLSFCSLGFWTKVLRDAENYNNELGQVTNTSGPSGDWAIIQIPRANIQNVANLNRHFPETGRDYGSGFQCLPDMDFSVNDSNKARLYFRCGPTFLPIQQVNTAVISRPNLYFKPPSRTIGTWVTARLNQIDTVLKAPNSTGIWSCLCFITPGNQQSATARKGDSGSLIFTREFRPIAMVYGGTEATTLNPSVTSAFSLDEVLRDIEEKCNWVVGDAVLC